MVNKAEDESGSGSASPLLGGYRMSGSTASRVRMHDLDSLGRSGLAEADKAGSR